MSGNRIMPAPVIRKNNASLIEIFSSAQGEGPLVGCRQIFIRFCGCNLDCAYCDTHHVSEPYCRVETAPGSQSFTRIKNPLGIEQVLSVAGEWQREFPGLHHSISLTGGEPLHYGHILLHWLPQLRKTLPIYLETNGTQPSVMADIIDDVDFVSMDIKLASVCGFDTPWERHRQFLEVCRIKLCCVKLVVDINTPTKEIRQACELISKAASGSTVVLQPLTRDNAIHIPSSRLLELQAEASQLVRDVRIIPQTHRFLDLL